MRCPHCKKIFERNKEIELTETVFNLAIKGKKEELEKIRSHLNKRLIWLEDIKLNPVLKLLPFDVKITYPS